MNKLHIADNEIIAANIENIFFISSEKRKKIKKGQKMNSPNAWIKVFNINNNGEEMLSINENSCGEELISIDGINKPVEAQITRREDKNKINVSFLTDKVENEDAFIIIFISRVIKGINQGIIPIIIDKIEIKSLVDWLP